MSQFLIMFSFISQLYPTSDDISYKALIPELIDTGTEVYYKQRNDLWTPNVHDFLTFFIALASTNTW